MGIQTDLNGAANDSGPAPVRNYYARNLPIYYLFECAGGFLIWLPIWMVYLLDVRGMSLSQIAIMEGLYWVTIVLAEVPTGAIADRWGRRTSLLLGSICFTLASLLFAFSSTFLLLTACYLLMSLSMTLFSGAGPALLYDTLRQLGRTNEYERHIGRAEAGALGAMLTATMLGGPLTALVGFQGTILIGAAATATAAAVALLLREPLRNEAAFDAAAHAAEPTGLIGNMRTGAALIRRRRTLLGVILFGTLLFSVSEMTEFLLQPFVRDQGVNPREGLGTGGAFSALIAPPLAGMMIGALLAARFVNRAGEGRTLPLVLAASAVLFLPLIVFDSLWVLAPIFLLAVLRGTISPIASGYINRRIPSDQRATVLSMFELSMGLMMIVIVPSAGRAADSFNFQTAFALCLIVLVVIGGLFGLLWRRAHEHELIAASSAERTDAPAGASHITPRP